MPKAESEKDTSEQTSSNVAESSCISVLRKLSHYQRKLGGREMLSKISIALDKTDIQSSFMSHYGCVATWTRVASQRTLS